MRWSVEVRQVGYLVGTGEQTVGLAGGAARESCGHSQQTAVASRKMDWGGLEMVGPGDGGTRRTLMGEECQEWPTKSAHLDRVLSLQPPWQEGVVGGNWPRHIQLPLAECLGAMRVCPVR
jgi:hypothetical protein